MPDRNRSGVLGFRVICVIVGFGFAGACVWASLGENVGAALARLAQDPWGAVTLFDVGIGLAFVAVCIAITEANAVRAALWIAALLCLGNLVTIAYLMARSRRAHDWRSIVRLAPLEAPPPSSAAAPPPTPNRE